MNYLLDTCVISELVKPAPDDSVIRWLKGIPSDNLHLCVITIGELRKGIEKLPDSRKKSELIIWLTTLLEDYQDRIYPIDLSVAENWGIIQGAAEKSGNPMASLDSLIAAVAYTNNLTLVTRNERDFEAGGLPIINPWNAEIRREKQ
ncbi:type II toxin-antitoxin system VapC family toxin [bacterium]|nr:type II toxin-antitoxin system VapC family toxin [candidate division CSSED10-310 bacterium]